MLIYSKSDPSVNVYYNLNWLRVALIDEVDSGSSVFWRLQLQMLDPYYGTTTVYVGKYSSREDAEAALDELVSACGVLVIE